MNYTMFFVCAMKFLELLKSYIIYNDVVEDSTYLKHKIPSQQIESSCLKFNQIVFEWDSGESFQPTVTSHEAVVGPFPLLPSNLEQTYLIQIKQ